MASVTLAGVLLLANVGSNLKAYVLQAKLESKILFFCKGLCFLGKSLRRARQRAPRCAG